MLLDLREIIELPGGKVPFDYQPDLSGVVGGLIIGIKDKARATGTVTNNAGVLTLSCALETVFEVNCARCLKELDFPVRKIINADITESGIGENPDGYYLNGNEVDLTEIIVTELILDLNDRILCRDDCAGLCQNCGADLNSETCTCRKETDPRLAVLGQLLDMKE